MNIDKVPVVTEEPYPGWLRYEVEGEKPWYRSPVPRTTIRNVGHLSEYLRKEQARNNMLDVSVSGFSFKRRFGLRTRSAPSVSTINKPITENDTNKSGIVKPTSAVERLIRNSEPIDHRKLLSRAAGSLDSIRQQKEVQVAYSYGGCLPLRFNSFRNLRTF